MMTVKIKNLCTDEVYFLISLTTYQKRLESISQYIPQS